MLIGGHVATLDLSFLAETGVSQRMIPMDLASMDKVTGPWGQGRAGWHIWAGPCPNFKATNDLN
jgi:hypothetical protein